jgi:hypothetical protein
MEAFIHTSTRGTPGDVGLALGYTSHCCRNWLEFNLATIILKKKKLGYYRTARRCRVAGAAAVASHLIF